MDGGSMRYDDTGLRRLNALFGGPTPVVRVGILSGSKMARKHNTGSKNSTETNADIGAIQEYGSFSRHIPPRSFLHKPLSSDKARKRIVKDAAEGVQRQLNRGESVDPKGNFYGQIGAGLVVAVHDAFDASGPGWAPLAQSTLDRRRKRKKWPRQGTKPLIDTGELRQAISFKVIGAKR